MVVVASFDFVVNQSPNLWILGLEIWDLDFRLDSFEIFKDTEGINVTKCTTVGNHQMSNIRAKRI